MGNSVPLLDLSKRIVEASRHSTKESSIPTSPSTPVVMLIARRRNATAGGLDLPIDPFSSHQDVFPAAWGTEIATEALLPARPALKGGSPDDWSMSHSVAMSSVKRGKFAASKRQYTSQINLQSYMTLKGSKEIMTERTTWSRERKSSLHHVSSWLRGEKPSSHRATKLKVSSEKLKGKCQVTKTEIGWPNMHSVTQAQAGEYQIATITPEPDVLSLGSTFNEVDPITPYTRLWGGSFTNAVCSDSESFPKREQADGNVGWRRRVKSILRQRKN